MGNRLVSVYGLDLNELTQTITVPKDSKVLGAVVHHEGVGITIEHCADRFNPVIPQEEIEFAVFQDGQHFYIDDYTYVGTIVLNFGNDIYQVFYKKL